MGALGRTDAVAHCAPIACSDCQPNNITNGRAFVGAHSYANGSTDCSTHAQPDIKSHRTHCGADDKPNLCTNVCTYNSTVGGALTRAHCSPHGCSKRGTERGTDALSHGQTNHLTYRAADALTNGCAKCRSQPCANS